MRALLWLGLLTLSLTASLSPAGPPTLPGGRDIRAGVDVKTIHQAIKMAQPGDTIHLQPIVYHDFAGFYGTRGAPGRPITLGGHGATLEGCDPLNPAKWKEVSPGLFANDQMLPRLDDGVLVRWFFLWNGRMDLKGRTSKGKKAASERRGFPDRNP
jgi:hypothetical protein